MRTKIFDDFIVLAGISGLIYLILIGIKDFVKNIYRKFRVSEIRVTNVNMTIKNKSFLKGMPCNYSDRNKYFISNLPNSYLLELEYKDKSYRINDKNIFETVNIGDNVMIRLIEKFDKYENLLSYKLENMK
ncbi:hypothetical protein [Clostridium sp. CCUG 7971]|uniref:hypothetical protein n=1 Tax=Clostridium sp. CCUG 7971 TaxID=2811414 RepID=UPI001ABABA85|nr:hypothetical protein [Clostridium sp. CCUG 7971]MBO3443923.1 hypothetical protein [Clostridium sp. CCUG 7971]